MLKKQVEDKQKTYNETKLNDKEYAEMIRKKVL